MKNIFLVTCILCLPLFSSAQNIPEGFAEEVIVSGLDNPTSIDFAPDGRIFISEKGGDIKIVENGQLLQDAFLSLDVETDSECGVQSVLLDPDFESNYYVYVYYRPANEDKNRVIRVTANGNFAIPGSEYNLLTLDSADGNIHNGGAMKFAADGRLFVSTGDGAWSYNSQDLEKRSGKILRINKDGSIPEDNPFYDELTGDKRAIYAYGLRNPFTMDLDVTTGKFLVNDVGADLYEEINEIIPGGNYGWSLVEGYLDNQDSPENYVDPLFAYEHDHEGCAITAGTFYDAENKLFPEKYHGVYFYADFCKGYINALDPETGEIKDTLRNSGGAVTSMSVDPGGSLYYMSFHQGELRRIFYSGTGEVFFTNQPESVLVTEDETASYTAGITGEGPYSFQWYMNDTPVGGDSLTLELSSVSVADSNSTIYVEVTNSYGTTRSDVARLFVTSNSRPVPEILLPLSEALYSGGDTLTFKGTAMDPEDGELGKDNLSWKIDFFHDKHFHPGMPWTSGIDSGTYVIPQVGELSTNVWYRIYLTATDEQGFSQTISRDIHPHVVTVGVDSEPSGLRLNVDGNKYTTPAQISAVSGMKRIVIADEYQISSDSKLYIHDEWDSENTGNQLEFTVPLSDTTIRAAYNYDQEFYRGNGGGLKAKYYNNSNWNNSPVFTRIDTTIDFIWSWGGPEDGVGTDNFSVTWEGSILAPVTGEYTFELKYNEKAVVLLDGEEQIFNLSENLDLTYEDTFQVSLTGGEYYNLHIDYAEEEWTSICQFKWKYPSQALTTVPKEYLSDTILEMAGKEENEAKVYPNPVENHLYITAHQCTGNQKYTIFNLEGQIVSHYQEVPCGVSGVLKVDDLAPGLYLLKIETDTRVHTARFVKN